MAETTETPVSTLTPFQEWAAIPDSDQQLSSATEIDTAARTVPASDPVIPVEDKEEKLPKGLKKRFSELTSEIRELRAQLAKPVAGEPGAATLPKEPVKAAEPGKPKAADFETYEDFVEALTDYKADQRDALRASVDARTAQQATVKTQVDAARARHDDYDQVVTDQVPISPAMAEVLVAMEHGAEVAYVLGSDPDEAARIAKLTPAQAGAALARIEAGLGLEKTSTPAKPKTAISKAPTPPKILNGSGNGGDPEPPSSDFPKWEKWYNREQKRLHPDA